MASIREHTSKSKKIFGDASLGKEFQELLDKNRFTLGMLHRLIDHDFERLLQIGEQYGEQGFKEILLHLAMDYKFYGNRKSFKDQFKLVVHPRDPSKKINLESITVLGYEELNEFLAEPEYLDEKII